MQITPLRRQTTEGTVAQPSFASIPAFAITLLVWLTLCACSVRAQERPRVVMILCDGLTMDELQSADSSALQAWARLGTVGVMNDVVPGPRSLLSATLTLATGQQARSEPTDAQAAEDGETVAGESGTARSVYARRMGTISTATTLPDSPIWHLGMASLERRGLASDRLDAALARATPPVRAELYGNADTDLPDRRAALLTVNAVGIGAGRIGLRHGPPGSPFGIIDDPLKLMHALTESDADLIVLQLGDLGRAEAARAHLTAPAYRQARHEALLRLQLLLSLLSEWMRAPQPHTDLLIVSSFPPAEARRYPVVWTRLTPVVAYGPDFGTGLLTSATTRTPGLIANVDIAPTLLQIFHASIPQTMVGRPLQVTAKTMPAEARLAMIARKEFVSALGEAVETWGMVPITLICLGLIVIGMILRRTRGPQAARRFAWAIVLLQSLTAATLLGPILIPPTAEEYTLRIAAWMGALTLASYLLARVVRISPPVASSILLLALLVGDTCLGQTLQKDSLLCSDAVSGLRYYGIGNEYLGPLLAAALSGLFALLDDRGVRFPPAASERGLRVLAILAWLFIMVALGWPGWGANAGSLACTGAGFGVGTALLCGRRVTFGLAAGCVAFGLALAFAFGVVDASHSGGATSHAGAALQAASGGRGPGYLVEIIVRKVGMNLRLLASPPFWLLAAMALLPLGAGNALVGGPLRRALARRPWSAQGLKATFATLAAALLFKDSGVITAAGLFAVSCACPLYAALTDPDAPDTADPKTNLS